MSAADNLNRVSKEHAEKVSEYRELLVAAGQAEARHKSARAKKILSIKADDTQRMSQAEAETRAEADDEIADLHMQRLVSAAEADAALQKLHQVKQRHETARAYFYAERDGDKLHARGGI